MHLRYDDDFVEAAVFVAASGRRPGVPGLQIRRFHAARERCYQTLDPDDRNAAFFLLHLDWFREWGLEALLLELLAEYPLLRPALNTLAFRQARMKKDEGAELYVSAESGRSAVVAMRPERFARDDAVTVLLRHECQHVSDMVDPAFGYSPVLALPGLNPAQQRITRERYRLLWDITIDGRLTRAGRASPGRREEHAAQFHRTFHFWPDERRALVFDSYWHNPTPRHEQLLALAADPRDLNRTTEPVPGSACPLCHFATFEWANLPEEAPESLARLQAQFPNWDPSQGACRRCMEVYDLIGKFELPSTVVL